MVRFFVVVRVRVPVRQFIIKRHGSRCGTDFWPSPTRFGCLGRRCAHASKYTLDPDSSLSAMDAGAFFSAASSKRASPVLVVAVVLALLGNQIGLSDGCPDTLGSSNCDEKMLRSIEYGHCLGDEGVVCTCAYLEEVRGADCSGCACLSTPTVSPSVSHIPTSTHAPSLSGTYEVVAYDELIDAIESAEEGREWLIYVTHDLSANEPIGLCEVASNMHIKMVGPNALGRARVVSTSWTNLNFFIVDRGVSNGFWFENLEIVGFYGAITLGANSTLVLVNCRLSQMTGPSASAVHVSHSVGLRDAGAVTVVVRRSEFADNSADDGGGAGIGIYGRAIVDVVDTVFARNAVRPGTSVGAAIYVAAEAQPSRVTIRNCSFIDNISGFRGGAVAMGSNVRHGTAMLSIQDSKFHNNTAAAHAGAIFIGSKIELVISNTNFSENVARGTSGGGAIATSSDSIVTIKSSFFSCNKALNGPGGALVSEQNKINIIDSNFSGNFAATDGGAVSSEKGTALYPRGSTHFVRNRALGRGGAISLDASSLKTNDGAIFYAQNVARLGGALSATNMASVIVSAASGCQLITFEMNWALSATLDNAEGANFAWVRRTSTSSNVPTPVPTDQSTVAPSSMSTHTPDPMDEVVDERGQWTMLAPSSTEDTSATFCLAPGEYEIVGSEGAYCAEGWGGGYVRVVDTIGNAILAYFTMVPNDGCSAIAVFAVRKIRR